MRRGHAPAHARVRAAGKLAGRLVLLCMHGRDSARVLLTAPARADSVLASRQTPREEVLGACHRVCELAPRCSEQQLLAFKRSGGTSAITALMKKLDDEEMLDAAAAALSSLSGASGARDQARVLPAPRGCAAG